MLHRLRKWLAIESEVEDQTDEIARFRIAENATLLAPANTYPPTYPRSKAIRRGDGKYVVMREIDGHPDLHDYLWDRAGAEIPRECCWIIRARAAFANPDTNIIFATSRGTHDLRIRISDRRLSTFQDYDTEPSGDDPGFRCVRSRLRMDDDRAFLAMAYEDSKIRKE
jgi:hypothetical protein